MKQALCELQQDILSYLESQLNESVYRTDVGYGDIEVEGLQGRRRWALLDTLRRQGCIIEQTADNRWILEALD